jgi:BirA family biotin operon repressor/biotin-[acetyl-CoA-carboxylase] ligase
VDTVHEKTDKSADALAQVLSKLRVNGRIRQDLWPDGSLNPTSLGLKVEAGHLVWSESLRLHDSSYLHHHLSKHWPELADNAALRVFDIVDSTNTQMVLAAQQQSVHRHLYVAEFQSAGRGRRGRDWYGDFGRNLAMTVGHRCNRGLAELGGLSCVVGLALIQVLEQLGISAQVKWPNDIWVSDRKLAGILVELVQSQEGVTAVVGIGINVNLGSDQRHQIDQATTSLKELGCSVERDEFVVRLYQTLQENFAIFEVEGFPAFVSAFNTVHRLHNQPAILYLGDTQRTGVIRGLDDNGGILFDEAGVISTIVGGEVSLRPNFSTKAPERPTR